jgi:hypothetical protein
VNTLASITTRVTRATETFHRDMVMTHATIIQKQNRYWHYTDIIQKVVGARITVDGKVNKHARIYKYLGCNLILIVWILSLNLIKTTFVEINKTD